MGHSKGRDASSVHQAHCLFSGMTLAPSRRLQSQDAYWVPCPESWLVPMYKVQEEPLNQGMLELKGMLGPIWAPVTICQRAPPFTLASRLW